MNPKIVECSRCKEEMDENRAIIICLDDGISQVFACEECCKEFSKMEKKFWKSPI